MGLMVMSPTLRPSVNARSIAASPSPHHRNPDRALALVQARLLEVSDHESVGALSLGLDGVADDPRGDAELRDRVKVPVRRRDADDFVGEAGVRDRIQMVPQAFDVRALLLGVHEALIPDATRVVLRHAASFEGFSGSHLPEDFHRVSGDLRVRARDEKVLGQSLRHEETVERVAVVIGQLGNSHGVAEADG